MSPSSEGSELGGVTEKISSHEELAFMEQLETVVTINPARTLVTFMDKGRFTEDSI